MKKRLQKTGRLKIRTEEEKKRKRGRERERERERGAEERKKKKAREKTKKKAREDDRVESVHGDSDGARDKALAFVFPAEELRGFDVETSRRRGEEEEGKKLVQR